MKQQPFASFIGLLAGALLAIQSPAHAQSATIYGSVGNFDVANNQEQETHGFEIEFEGVHPEDISSTFNTERYGAPTISETATGTIVRWAGYYDPAIGFTATTAPHQANGALAGACYQWAGAAYNESGCEHFGVSLRVNATRTSYHWLVADAAAPGALVAGAVPVVVAAPAYSVAPPIAAGATPVLNADIDAPAATGYPTRYGDAFWMKVFKTELARGVSLDELTNDNPDVVPEDAAHVEASWTLIQADPLIRFKSGKGSPSRGRTRNGGPMRGDTHAVVRRYELYEYAGMYDPVFHQAVCALSNCSAPASGEVGALLSAQMTAANVVVPSISVTTAGRGSIASADQRISCGATCTAAYTSGTVVTLAATPAAGSIFAGWSGGCSGAARSCSVLVTDHVDVGATFTAAPVAAAPPPAPAPAPAQAPAATGATVKLSVAISNKGNVVGSSGGINCPNGSCSGKVGSGTTVTLTASPTVGPFVSWSGACTGTQPTCTLTLTRDAQVQATFGK